MSASRRVGELLDAASAGDPTAAADLLPLVYEELRLLAAARLAGERENQTLQPTALVHEAYLRLVGQGDPGWQSRGHFFGAAAKAMGRVLVDYARRRLATKRNAGCRPVALDERDIGFETPAEDVIALTELIERLEAHDPRKARLVSLKYFAGLSHEQVADALGITVRTVERDWRFARAWLQTQWEADRTSREEREP